ncbi:receptor activity-modifying protein 1-like [Anabas testudineus]|uniref:Uncharacterized protein n=1 Tax=Anabas testudineus TaxID=64144 RepID=A0A7N5ZQ77_ANATE|nr:receptor activity-modifying protein 1-like [Anabas testudineus]
MILYLLAPFIILGFVESLTNVTNTPRTEERNTAEQNQTFTVSPLDKSTITPDNVSQIEDGLKNNQSLITEDNEAFQDYENHLSLQGCSRPLLIKSCQVYCVNDFQREMEKLSTEDWCVMEKIIIPYNIMTLCMEGMSQAVRCYYPNQDIENLFLDVHSSYFKNCTKEELQFEDAPKWLVITLTLIPVSLIPILTYLVVWKSKVQE